jgi:two-component system, chemotaxis family, protein-glutamate methylesterase/glutaminase
MLDDGVAGLAEIKRRGGMAIVEDPATAAFPSMPSNAVKYVEVDHVVPLPQIAGLVSALAATERIAIERHEPMERNPSSLTCSECRAVHSGRTTRKQRGISLPGGTRL